MAETTASIKAQAILDSIREVVDALGTVHTTKEAKSALLKLAVLFSRNNDPVTSFELLESGLVEGLPRFATEFWSFGPYLSARSELLSETFFFFLRSTASMLARQLKIRLVAAKGTDVPKNCANVVVSSLLPFKLLMITFAHGSSKLNDERLGRPSGSSTSRLSGMLAAFVAVSSLLASSSSSPSTHLEDSSFTLPSRTEATESAQPSSLQATTPEVLLSAHAPRRSSRPSGRGLTAEDLNRETADVSLTQPSSSALLSTSAPKESMDRHLLHHSTLLRLFIQTFTNLPPCLLLLQQNSSLINLDKLQTSPNLPAALGIQLPSIALVSCMTDFRQLFFSNHCSYPPVTTGATQLDLHSILPKRSTHLLHLAMKSFIKS
ncbi:hypothetical protein PCANC_18580 [Puccinia coronata f. sp. avenae]|uniref:Uncharacterized protein n=1 Tax=Puccinia coronata f. sp. avenae TaxID=200324 RepID=A0A2N5RWQ8_9BASI|nr:hypothetical protein PCANC_25125 [Puccinia coronata f. sp. avenae]PLW26694.1 hypothetical protein PCANC_18580 [Puccinia coronata f. sp. avenae]